MPSPLETRDRKKHSLSESTLVENWGSSGFRTKRRKREYGANEWTGKSSVLFPSVEPNLEPFQFKRKTMDARKYKSRFKRKPSKDEKRGTNGVSNGSDFQILPRDRPTDNLSKRGLKSLNLEKSLPGHLKPGIMRLCQVLQLPEKVRVMVEKFLKYVYDKHEVITEPQTKLHAFQISLCWNAASLLKYKIDKKESLILAKQYLQFGCSVEEVNDVDSTLQKLRNTFVIDLFNVKELDSSKNSIPAIRETKKVQEQTSEVLIDDRESQRCREKAERKLEVRIKRLDKEQKSEIYEFNKKWEKQKVELLEHHKKEASLVRSRNSDNKAKLNELKCLKNELRKKLEELKCQKEMSLKDITALYLAKKSKQIEKKGQWLGKKLRRKSVNAFENNTVTKLPCSEEVKEGARMKLVGDLYTPGNGSEIAAKSPSCEEQLPNEQQSIVEKVRKSSSQNNCAAKSISENNIAGISPSSEVRLPLGATPSVKEATESAGNKLFRQQERCRLSTCAQTANIEAPTQKDDEQIPTQVGISDQTVNQLVLANPSEQHQPSSGNISVDKYQPTSPSVLPTSSPGSGHGLVLAAHNHCASNNISENNIAAKLPSSEEQLPFGASPGVKEVMKSAASDLFLPQESSQLSTSAQTYYIEAQAEKDDDQIPIEVGTCDHTVNELVSTIFSEKQQPTPSADISIDTIQQLPPSANIERTQSQPPSLNIGTNQPIPPSDFIDTNLPLPVGTNRCHSVPPPVVELAPPRECPIITTPSLTHIRDESFLSSRPQTPRVASIDDNNLGTAASVNNYIGDMRLNPVYHNTSQTAPQMPVQGLTTNSFSVDTSQYLSLPAFAVEQVLQRESHVTTSSITDLRNESPLSSQPQPPLLSNNDNNCRFEDMPVFPDQSTSRVNLGAAPVINGYMGDLRSYSVLHGACQSAPQMAAQRLTLNPLYNEYERLCRETDRVVQVHENMKLQLRSDCEKEIAEIRKKYEFKLNEAETDFSTKKKELDMNSSKVLMNGLYAQSFQNMVEYKSTFKLPQEVPSNVIQQVHLPHSQAQPILSPSNSSSLASALLPCNRSNSPNFIIPPSNFTSSAPVLSPCNRPNISKFISSITLRPNFRDNFIHGLPLPHFRPEHPLSATSFSSVPQRRPSQQPTLQSVQFGMGPQAAVIENPYVIPKVSSFPNQIQMVTHQPSILQSVPGCGSTIDLLSQVLGNNGGCRGTNTGNSRGMTGYICLSDDD